MSSTPQEPTAFSMKAPKGISGSTIYITQGAVDRLEILLAQEKIDLPDKDSFFRITVLSGGCHGFQYKFDFSHEAKPEDLLFSHAGVQVVVDDVSFDLLEDVTLDYAQEMIGAAFTLKNPNASISCGCGNSFSI